MDHKLFWPQGAAVRVPPDGFNYLGWLVAAGESRAGAAAGLAACAALFRFDLAPLAAGPFAVAARAAAARPAAPEEAEEAKEALPDPGRAAAAAAAAAAGRLELAG